MGRRLQIIYSILRPPVRLYLWLKFGYTCETAKNLPDNYIVLSNHVTDYDPLMVAASFPRQMYFVASEHIGRWGFTSKLIDFLVAPILRKKGMSAASAILDCLRKLRQGGNVCMFAEGVRTWDGVTCPIAETTGQMVKRAGCGMVTYKIAGGYFLSPGWSDNLRSGWIHGAPTAVYTREQLAAMSADEINEIIRRDLYEDAYARQLAAPKRYKSKAPAADFTNLLYYCPHCESLDTVTSAGNTVGCTACGKTAALDACGMLDGMPFRTVTELAAWQKSKTEADARAGAAYTVPYAKLTRVEDSAVTVVAEGAMSLAAEGLTLGGFHADTDALSDLALHGRHALVFAVGKEYYEILIPRGSNILKFVQLYHALKACAAQNV